MTGVLRLYAADPEVWRRTCSAFLDCQGRKHSLTVKCRKCARILGWAEPTEFGPLFTSSWSVELPLHFETYVNGRKLNRRQSLRHVDKDSPVRERSGPPLSHETFDGVVALLALPIDLPQDYPDLLVRCPHHGDAILNRTDVLQYLREGGQLMKVEPGFPLRAYEYPDHEEPLPGGRAVHSREVRHYGCHVEPHMRQAAAAYLASIRPPGVSSAAIGEPDE